MSFQISGLVKLAAVALFASSALMQGAPQGTFHLPVRAYWGQAVLEPGDYSISAPVSWLGQVEFTVTSTSADKSVFALPVTAGLQPFSDSSTLELSNINGQFVVTEFSSGAAGRKYTFGVPKAVRKVTMTSSGDKLALMVR